LLAVPGCFRRYFSAGCYFGVRSRFPKYFQEFAGGWLLLNNSQEQPAYQPAGWLFSAKNSQRRLCCMIQNEKERDRVPGSAFACR
jgi:hypothetical protein